MPSRSVISVVSGLLNLNVMSLIFTVRKLCHNVILSISHHKGASFGNSLCAYFRLSILTVRSPEKYNVRQFKNFQDVLERQLSSTRSQSYLDRFFFQRGVHSLWLCV